MLSSLAILFIAPLFSDALYIEQHSTDTATLHSIPESTTLPRRAPTDSASITWSACPDPEIPPELECGTLLVPLDHAHPPSVAEYNANNTVELFMSRLKATGIPPDQIEGRASLIINPGGPGGTAWVMAVYQLQAEMAGHPDAVVSAAVRGKYDLIGVDPRGAGLSQGLKCDESLLKTKPSIRIQDEQEFEAMAEWNKQYAESCERLSGDLVRYMGTVSVAKDFELVRQALGEEKLNLFAMSYGSRIGAEYINLYPEHIGRFVLDGILDNTQDARGLMTSDAKAFEDALTFYFGWCNNSPECTAVLDTASPAVSCASKLFDRIMLKLQSDRLPAGGCDNPEAPCASSIGLEDFIKGVQEGLGNQDETDIRPNGWLTLTKCMVEVDGGDGTAFSPALAPSDGAVDIYAPSDPHAGTAVSCLESPRIGSFAEYAKINATLLTDYPHTKGISWAHSMVVGCIGWPVPVVDPPRPLNTEAVAKSAKVLLLQSTVDPSTNMDWAESLHRQLPNSRLVVRKGAGHTSMVLFGESSRTAETYLLEGALPDEDVQVDT